MGKHFPFASRLSERPCSMAHVSPDARVLFLSGVREREPPSSTHLRQAGCTLVSLPCALRKQLRQ